MNRANGGFIMINKVYVKDFVGFTGNEDATILCDLLKCKIDKEEKIEVSFKGIGCITCRFINTGLIALLDTISFLDIKKYVFIIDSNRQINSLINKRFKFEVDGVSS